MFLDGLDAAEHFFQLENRMRQARRVFGWCRVEAAGAYRAALAGGFIIQAGSVAEWRVDGDFNGQAVAPRLSADGSIMRGGSLDKTFEAAAPPGLSEALVVGLCRMGILHNLTRLAFGAPPDHAEGGVSDWVQVADFRADPLEKVDNRDLRPLTFTITVGGRPSGQATLWLDAVSGLPSHRRQTVHFPQGDMTVSENYPEFGLDGGPPPNCTR